MEDYIDTVDEIERLVNSAVREAGLAYEFSPGSYTASALTALQSAEHRLRPLAEIVRQLS
jgi:hypothetical protein